MDPEAWKTHTRSKCVDSECVSRIRKRVAAEADKRAAVETKYRCKVCQCEWREKVEGK